MWIHGFYKKSKAITSILKALPKSESEASIYCASGLWISLFFRGQFGLWTLDSILSSLRLQALVIWLWCKYIVNPALPMKAWVSYHSVTAHDVIDVLYIPQSQLSKQWSAEQKTCGFPPVDTERSLRHGYYFVVSAITCEVENPLLIKLLKCEIAWWYCNLFSFYRICCN